MARVVVVGAGLGGMAVAARLAKLGHRVTVCERAAAPGGALRRVEHEGFGWDAGPWSTTLPAVLRDLFRKSGRPLERVLELAPLTPARVHRFADGTRLTLPTGSRGDQIDAMSAALGEAPAAQWAELLDSLAPTWDLLRRVALERPFPGCSALDREQRRLLDTRRSLRRLARRRLHDERLRTLLEHPTVLQGSEPRATPAFMAVEAYVERTFGRWRPEGGMHAVATALTSRLAERRVDLRLRTAVTGIGCAAGRVDHVRLDDGGRIDADVVVGDIDPRRLFRLVREGPGAGDGSGPRTTLREPLREPLRPALRTALRDVDRANPAVPAAVTHLGLSASEDLPRLAAETVLHGRDHTLVVRPDAQAPAGHVAWTVLRRGDVGEDTLEALARHGIDVRPQVTVRLDRSPARIARDAGGSPYGVRWAGRRTVSRLAGNRTPVPGLFCVGASAHPGAGVPLVGLGAAIVAELVGKAGRP